MRCAICGGEIDKSTKKCTLCGECWGGGNRSIAQQVSYNTEIEYRPPSLTLIEKAVLFIKNIASAADKALVAFGHKITGLFGKKSSDKLSRIISCCIVLAAALLIAVIPAAACSSCASDELEGQWISEDSAGAVTIEFSSDNKISMYILSGGEEKLYRQGDYILNDKLIEIRYSDGESITMSYDLDGNTATFTLLSNGQSQTYKRK